MFSILMRLACIPCGHMSCIWSFALKLNPVTCSPVTHMKNNSRVICFVNLIVWILVILWILLEWWTTTSYVSYLYIIQRGVKLVLNGFGESVIPNLKSKLVWVPSGGDRVKDCSKDVKKRKSSIRASDSPGQDRFP